MADSAVVTGRNIGGIVANVTVSEEHNDEIEITQHPVESGAPITDHSFKKPPTVTLRIGWSNSSEQADGDSEYVKTIYQQLLDMQESRLPLDISTGKRDYDSMLIRSLALTTDKETENALMVTAICQGIIIVATSTTTVPDNSVQSSPQSTGGTQTRGSVNPTPASPNTGPNSGGLGQVLQA